MTTCPHDAVLVACPWPRPQRPECPSPPRCWPLPAQLIAPSSGPQRPPLQAIQRFSTVCRAVWLLVESELIIHYSAFRSKIRNEVLTYPPPNDPNSFEEKINLTREIADVLRKNVVQGVKVEDATQDGSPARFSEAPSYTLQMQHLIFLQESA